MVHPLTQRLIAFRAAYYRIQIIRGLLLTGLWSLLLLLLFSLSEGVFWWEVSIRQILWVIWLGGIFFFLGRWVVYPLLQYGLRLRGYLSDEEAARWIGRRLPEVRDTLLNAIQLHSQHAASNAAIALAIEERTRKLSVLPWEITLPRADIRRYGLFLLLTVLLSAFLWIASPTLFRGGALRFLQPHQAFLRPVPYTLRVEGLKPFYRQGEPLELFFFLSGEKLPAELYASSDEGPLPLQRKSPSTYTLALPSLQSSFTLHIEAPGELHREYPILVQKPPVIRDLLILAQPPAYTRQNPDTSSQPVLRVLKGTYIQLTLSVESARMYRLFSPSLPLEKAYPTHSWKGTFLALSSSSHTLYVQDSLFQDSLTLRVEVYPDYYPSVQLFSEWFNPETWEQGIRLRLMDDFGFSKGVLWYRIVEGATPARAQEKYQALPLAISSDATQERLMTLSWPSMGIQPGDKVEYFVEVWDNDLIGGPKASRSIAYTLEPLDEPAKQEIFADLQDSLFRELLSVQRALEKLLLEKEDLQKAQRSTTALSEKFRSLRSELRSLQRLAAEQQLYTPELLEQVRQLQKLLDAMDPQKPEQLLSQLLQQQTDSAKAAQLQEELERAYREWQEKMARFEALLPAYQQQRRLEELMTRLSEMAESEKRLSTLPDSLQHQPAAQSLQQRLLQDTRQLSRQVDSLRGLASPSPLQDSMEKALQHLQDAMHSMQKALQEMQRTEGKPQEDQKRAAEALEQALSTMDGGAQQEQADEEAEAYEALRLLLKGILSLSFRQEAVRKKTQESASFTGIAQTIIRDQNAIRRDYQQIHDSLFALANRSPVLEEALLDLLRDLEKYFQGLTFYQSELLLRRQQYILQGLNRLANLMTELLAQLEENQRNRQAGGGACQRSFKVRRKGATGRPSPSKNSAQGQSPTPQSTPRQGPIPSLQQLQHQLNESLQRALTPNPASENPGGTLSPEERARLSAQQELIRLRLQEWLQQHPGDAGQLQNLIEEMQKAEKDILGGALTRERLLRQQQILTRLLDYERSQQERELEPTRESRTARQFFERTTGIYPLPTLPLPPAPALRTTWIYQPSYQNLIERYFYHP